MFVMTNNAMQDKQNKSKSSFQKSITVALAGNPNSGKTTLFNSLTGSMQHVGNYPGVTVEKIEGKCSFGKTDFSIIDLPGTYKRSSINIYSKESHIPIPILDGSTNFPFARAYIIFLVRLSNSLIPPLMVLAA